MPTELVYVAIGSNVEPAMNFAIAVDALRARFPDLKLSTVYRNRAVGFSGADFLNAVLCFQSDASIEAILSHLHEVESLCGRRRDDPKWAPRRMDLDVLKFGDRVGEWPGVILPRPDLTVRPYMLGPFVELAPNAVDPHTQKSYAELWQAMRSDDHPMEATALRF
jgi:2-amino-4-hydroxy-6-hydroxymethyldihydropteridine diphosphokinase